MGLLSQVPIDGLHLMYGLHNKKLGPKALTERMSNCQQIEYPEQTIGSSRLFNTAQENLPVTPRTLEFLKDYKATQHRQFLLYFGIAATRGIY